MAGVRAPQVRVGHGFDVHRLVGGRALVLGGVRIPCDKGLLGHSDGDALLHAVADAILGAVGAGDIGAVFPSSDEANRDLPGETIVRKAMAIAKDRGYRTTQIDTTIVAEMPRLAPHQEAMRGSLTRLLELDARDVNVKVKSADGLGVIGSGEAIAAFAVAVVVAIE
ncbi:MAG: 2-C-methyl-D-erythritol 2,4-cyclodiphosphate synthase [Deltaproteobacteria bacterium]|nr:2-C-methyl-D-erythritol 2,4-cyclodiphosphate synthase [Deltaproteobacteria bacterium]